MRKLTIYIARHRPSTPYQSAHSHPCSNCSSVIKKIGIKKIVYVDDYGEINKCKTCDYKTNYITPGYKLYHQLNITPD
jgi:deoxycytidylate deaminase